MSSLLDTNVTTKDIDFGDDVGIIPHTFTGLSVSQFGFIQNELKKHMKELGITDSKKLPEDTLPLGVFEELETFVSSCCVEPKYTIEQVRSIKPMYVINIFNEIMLFTAKEEGEEPKV